MIAALLAALAGLGAPLPPCQVEDGSELTRVGQVCRWDAGASGNGVGESFTVVVTADGHRYLFDTGRVES